MTTVYIQEYYKVYARCHHHFPHLSDFVDDSAAAMESRMKGIYIKQHFEVKQLYTLHLPDTGKVLITIIDQQVNRNEDFYDIVCSALCAHGCWSS